MTAEQVRHARALLAQPDATTAPIARLLGVSRSTLYKYVPELKTGGDIQAIEPVTQEPGCLTGSP
jgi:transposase-like protein